MRKIKKMHFAAICAALVCTACIFVFAVGEKTAADSEGGISCNIDAPEKAVPEQEAKITFDIGGEGSKLEAVIDFGGNIGFAESEFFAGPESDRYSTNEYDIEEIETGKYLLTALGFDGKLHIESIVQFTEDGENTASVTGTYFGADGEECFIDEKCVTKIGTGKAAVPAEQQEESVTEAEDPVSETSENVDMPAEDEEGTDDGNAEDSGIALTENEKEQDTDGTEKNISGQDDLPEPDVADGAEMEKGDEDQSN